MKRLSMPNLDVLKRRRVLISIGVTIALFAVWYILWQSPESKKLVSVQAQVATQTAKLQSINSQIAIDKAEQASNAKNVAFLKFYSAAVPLQPEEGQIYTMLGKLFKADNVTLSTITANSTAVPAAGSALSSIPISFSVSGSHVDLTKLLNDMYALPRLITIQSAAPAPTAGAVNQNVLKTSNLPYAMNVIATAYFTGTLPTATP